MLRIPYPGPMTMTRTFYMRLSGNDKRKHHCLLPGLGRNATSLTPGALRLWTFLSHVFIPLDYGFLSLTIFYYRDSPYSGQRDSAKMKSRVCHSPFLRPGDSAQAQTPPPHFPETTDHLCFTHYIQQHIQLVIFQCLTYLYLTFFGPFCLESKPYPWPLTGWYELPSSVLETSMPWATWHAPVTPAGTSFPPQTTNVLKVLSLH